MRQPNKKDLENYLAKNPKRARYLLEKSLAQESLYDYAQVFWDDLEPEIDMATGWALEAMCEHLEAVLLGDIQNLLINVPPGMMKSLLVNVFMPTYEWGPLNRPNMKYIFASYAEGLMRRDNMRARDLIRGDRYQAMYGKQFRVSRKDTEKEFQNDRRGWRYATGVTGSLTGYRGDRLVVDDPHSVQGGDSDLDRQRAVRWFAETFYNRANDVKTVKRIVIMQRIHENDVSGHILDQLSDDWEKLILPMRFEADRRARTSIGFVDPREHEGELLFPERFPDDELTKMEKAMSSESGEYAVAGQMQQRPFPRGGGMFKTSQLEYVDVAPSAGIRVRGWDFAGSVKRDSPFTVGVKGLIAADGYLYVEDVVRFRAKIYDAEQNIVAVCRGEKSTRQSMPQDPGQAGLSQKSNLSAKLIGLNFHFSTESGAKEDRAIPLAAYVNAGKVRLVRGAWNKAFVSEMESFPRGKFKDQIDAASRMFQEALKQPRPTTGSSGHELV